MVHIQNVYLVHLHSLLNHIWELVSLNVMQIKLKLMEIMVDIYRITAFLTLTIIVRRLSLLKMMLVNNAYLDTL